MPGTAAQQVPVAHLALGSLFLRNASRKPALEAVAPSPEPAPPQKSRLPQTCLPYFNPRRASFRPIDGQFDDATAKRLRPADGRGCRLLAVAAFAEQSYTA